MSTILEVEKLALDLSEKERATLAANLLDSLPGILSDEDEGVAEALRPRRGGGGRSGPVATDISRIMDYYEGVTGPKLADDF